MLFASAVPLSVGVLLSVTPSPALAPVSGLMLVMTGAFGAVVSTVTANDPDRAPVLPARSVAVAVKEYVPSASGPVGNDQAPVPSALVEPIDVPSWNTVTVLFASAVPLSVGTLLSVTPS